MKRLLRRWGLLLSLLIGGTFSYAQFSSITHSLTYTAPSLRTIREEGRLYSVLSLNNLPNRGEQSGAPMLPLQRLMFGVPQNAYDFVVTIQGREAKTQALDHPIRPQPEDKPIGCSKSEEKNSLEIRSWEYSQILPRTRVDYYRDCKILQVDFYPVLYSTENRLLTSYRELSIQVSWKESHTEARKATYQHPMEKPYLEGMIANYQQYMQYEGLTKSRTRVPTKTPPSTLPSSCEYLIITTSDLYNSFKKLAQWKRRKGLDAKIVLLEDILQAYEYSYIENGFNDVQEKIRLYLQDLLSSSNGKFQFLVLGGSVEKIPARHCTVRYKIQGRYKKYRVYTDYYYTNLQSLWSSLSLPYNFYPDIAVGRVSVRTSEEVYKWVNKLYLYEADPGKGDPSYLGQGFCSEADELLHDHSATDAFSGPGRKWQGELTIVEESGGCNTSYLPDFPTGKFIIDEISKGYGFVSIMGHGTPESISVATIGFNTPMGKRKVYSFPVDIEASASFETENSMMDLRNKDKPSAYFSVSCHNTELKRPIWDRNIAETFTVHSPGGGPLFVGNSSVGLTIVSPALYQEQFRWLNYPIGYAINTGKSIYQDSLLVFSQVIYGCPEMKMWLRVPNKMHLSVKQTNGVEISGNDLIGAKVVIYQNLKSELGEVYRVYNVVQSNNLLLQDLPSSDYEIIILKDNYLPFIIPKTIYVQNKLITDTWEINAHNVYVGEHVTDDLTSGNVVLKASSNSTINYTNRVSLMPGTKIEREAKLVIRNKKQ